MSSIPTIFRLIFFTPQTLTESWHFLFHHQFLKASIQTSAIFKRQQILFKIVKSVLPIIFGHFPLIANITFRPDEVQRCSIMNWFKPIRFFDWSLRCFNGLSCFFYYCSVPTLCTCLKFELQILCFSSIE